MSFLTAIGAAGLATAFFAVWMGFAIGGDMPVAYVSDVGTLVAAVAAAVLCARAGLRQERRMRPFWWLLAAASASWASGEAIWAVYDLVLQQEVPVPSWADAGYLPGIPLAVAALLAHPALHGRSALKARSLLDGLVIATALLFLSWSFVLQPLWESAQLDTLGRIVAIAYPFGDVVIVFCIVLAVRRMPRGDRVALVCLLGGLLAMALSDSVYAYMAGVKGYETGALFDVGWFVGYLAIALGAFRAGQPVIVQRTPESSQAALGQLVAPFVPVLVALTAAAIHIQLGHRFDGVDLGIAFGLIVLALARQCLFILDVMRAQREGGVTGRLEHAAYVGIVETEQPR